MTSTQLEPTDAHFAVVARYLDLLERFSTHDRYWAHLLIADALPITADSRLVKIERDPEAEALNVDRWVVSLQKAGAPEMDALLFYRDGELQGIDLVERIPIADVNDSEFLRKTFERIAAPANDNNPDGEIPQDAPLPGLADALCYPPGIVGDISRWIVSASRFPSPTLALGASVALVSALVGRRYKGPTGLRSNAYIIGLAESGFGKDTSLRAITNLLCSTRAGERVLDKFVIDDASSIQGLAAKLRKDPAALLPIDEFGKWLADHTGRGAPLHKQAIATALMQLTGAPTGVWGGTEKAAGNVPRVYAPCLSLFGVSTPSTFWNALGSGNISEGLLGRMILFDAGNVMPKKVRNPASLEDVPPALSKSVEELIGGKIGGNLFGLTSNGEQKPEAVIGAAWAAGVADIFESFDDRIRAEIPRTDPQYRPMLTRVAENAGRLALIVAAGCNPSDPVITADIQTWANSIAEASLRAMMQGAAENVHDNERQAEYVRLRSFIERKGAEGVKHRLVLRHPRGRIDSRQIQDIITTLQKTGEIDYAAWVSPSGQMQKRWWSTKHLPHGAVPGPAPWLFKDD